MARARWRWLAAPLALSAALVPLNGTASVAVPANVYTQNICVAIWSQPSESSAMLANVADGSELRVTGLSRDGQWYGVELLDEIPAWVPISAVAPAPPATELNSWDGCPFPGTPPGYGNPVSSASGTSALRGAGTIVQPTLLRSSPGKTARVVATLAPGQRATVSAWSGDSDGDVWYLAHAGGTLGWLWAYALRFDAPDPGTHEVNGKPIWAPVAGKGMWVVNYMPRHFDAHALITAAKKAGITHIYLEVATSRDGFYGQHNLDILLPLAHAAGIAVLAWVYPWLGEGVSTVAEDLLLAQQVVSFRTPNGDRPDGIAADIEEDTAPPDVYTYGQVLRQMVGPDTLLVVTTYNPYARMSYPFPEVAANFNVIAPQDYWHDNTYDTFTAASPRALLTLTVATIRAELGGRDFPIEELGMMYDIVPPGNPDGNNPSGAEIAGDLQAAKDFGCIGVSYYRWDTASPDELAAFDSFTW